MLLLLNIICLYAAVAQAAPTWWPWFPFWAPSPNVNVPGYGFVHGRTINAYGTNVQRYLGLPYAKNPPPRFGAPEKVGFVGAINAGTFGPACVQQGTLLSNVTEAEDCLSLNIWAPWQASTRAKKPVMVWIYGGNLASGSTNQTIYNGTSIAANQNVVVVTINYRTNIFGFSMTPHLPLAERNAGFLDQRLALSWIKDNIGAFGGDADKITIFGESAGGFSVQQLISYPPEPLTFRAAILESRGFTGPANGTSGWDSAVTALNCTGRDELACMRSKSATEIKTKVAGIRFAPILDDTTYTNNTEARVATGKTAKVPVLIGTNSDEGNTLARSITFATPAIITAYEFTCKTGLYAGVLVNASYPVWRYYYNASFPNTTPFPGAGAYHGSEIPEVFGTYPLPGVTEQQIQLSKYMQSAWAQFARNPSGGPAQDWPKYDNQGKILRLGRNETAEREVINVSVFNETCSAYNGLIQQVGYKRN